MCLCFLHFVLSLPLAEKQQSHHWTDGKSNEATASIYSSTDTDTGQQKARPWSLSRMCVCKAKLMLLYKGYIYISHTCGSKWQLNGTRPPKWQPNHKYLGAFGMGFKNNSVYIEMKSNIAKKQLLLMPTYFCLHIYLPLFCKIHISPEIENAFNWVLPNNWHLQSFNRYLQRGSYSWKK